MCVIKAVIVNNSQSIRFVVFLQTIEWIGMVVRILNLKGHKHCMIDLKVTTILMTFLFMINSDFFGSGSSLLWMMGESAGECLWLLALVTGGK